MMTTLYVRETGSCVRRVGQRLQVMKNGEVLADARLRDLERVVLFGNVELSGPAMCALLDAGIDTVLMSYYGKFRGRLAAAEGKNVFLRRQQFVRYEDGEFRLRISRQIVGAKVRNGRHLLQRHFWNHGLAELPEAIELMGAGRERVFEQKSIATLLGIEGSCARVYFEAFGKIVRSEFAFTVRSRRPPRDPVNALLSFGYALLCSELTGAVAAQGLDPHVGVLHELDYGRPSLALDLEEEFRQPVVDRLVLSVVNRGMLKAEHFEDRGEAGVLLNDVGRPLFLECYHKAMETEFVVKPTEERTTFRGLLFRQANRMRKAIEGSEEYVPYEVQ